MSPPLHLDSPTLVSTRIASSMRPHPRLHPLLQLLAATSLPYLGNCLRAPLTSRKRQSKHQARLPLLARNADVIMVPQPGIGCSTPARAILAPPSPSPLMDSCSLPASSLHLPCPKVHHLLSLLNTSEGQRAEGIDGNKG